MSHNVASRIIRRDLSLEIGFFYYPDGGLDYGTRGAAQPHKKNRHHHLCYPTNLHRGNK